MVILWKIQYKKNIFIFLKLFILKCSFFLNKIYFLAQLLQILVFLEVVRTILVVVDVDLTVGENKVVIIIDCLSLIFLLVEAGLVDSICLTVVDKGTFFLDVSWFDWIPFLTWANVEAGLVDWATALTVVCGFVSEFDGIFKFLNPFFHIYFY